MSLSLNRLPLSKLVLPFCIGIGLSSYIPYLSADLSAFLIFLLLLGFVWVWIAPKQPLIKSSLLVSIFLILGFLHHHNSNPTQSKGHFSQISHPSFLITSIIETKQLEDKTRALCEVKYAGFATDSIATCKGLIMVYFNGLSQENVRAGDLYLIEADYLEESQNTNPLVFNYKRYLQNRGIYHKIYLQEDEYLSLEASHMNIWNLASLSRTICLDIFRQHIDSDQNLAVASAMVLGQRNLLSDDLYDAFTDTGAVHILAVSGLHVGIVSGLIALLLRRFRNNSWRTRAMKLFLSLAGVWAFALLTGGAAAVIRAGTMFSLYFVGRSFNSPPISLNILAAAALAMLIYDPAYLFQAGFQFSFLALIGIMYFYPHLIRMFTIKNKALKWVWVMIVTSISAQALVSPLAISYFHKLPTYFWLTGIIAVPLAGLILSTGIATLALHLSFGGDFIFTKIVGVCFNKLLSLLNFSIYKIQELPFCSTDDLWLSTKSIILFYCAFLSISLFLKFRKPIYLILTTFFLLLQSIGHIIENNTFRDKKSLFVYDVYNESLVHLFNNGVLTAFTPGINNPKQIEYITANNELHHRIFAEKLPDEIGIDKSNNFYLINDKLMLFYPDEKVLEWSSSIPIDLVVLSKDSYHDISRLANNYKIHQIVLDGTLGSKKYKLRKIAAKNNIPIHLTSLDGALEYQL